MTRRGFITGATVAAGVSVAGLAGCSPTEQTGGETPSGSPASTAQTPTQPEWGLPPYSETADETLEADIVIVGSGMAGMAAALTAAEAGASVIVVEKNGEIGGGTNFAEGIFAIESPLQQELGVEGDVRLMLQAEYEFQRYNVDSTLWTVVANNSPTDIRWLMDEGVEFSELGAGSAVTIIRTQHMYLEHRGKNALAVMEAKATSLGVTIRKNARASHILKDGDKVAGIQAETAEGILNVNAKAVILATGGAGNTNDLINTYTNRNADNMYWCGAPGITGDGIMMASEAGMGRPYRIAGPGLGVTVEPLGVSSQLGAAGAMEPTNLWVNQDARRFANEGLTMSYIYATNSVDSQLKTFSVFDQTQFDRMVNEGCIRGWGYYVNKGTKLTELQAELDREIANGNPYVFAAETLDELAEAMGIDAETFKATVDTYNGYVEQGEDPDFVKDVAYLVPVKTAPFYGFRVKSSIVQWVGGIHVNSAAEVIQADGTPIPGLYAGGIECAGFQGETYGLSIPGSCQGIALGFGRQSAHSAVEYIAQ
ncbi:MAG: FAD-dependent oxidoreductase [Bifidobacteriaceae bacterium]|nr:FAD-dependent oxidoreductase [Bifidobacteriaceae bacterium]